MRFELMLANMCKFKVTGVFGKEKGCQAQEIWDHNLYRNPYKNRKNATDEQQFRLTDILSARSRTVKSLTGKSHLTTISHVHLT